jgi:hypothetical protein
MFKNIHTMLPIYYYITLDNCLSSHIYLKVKKHSLQQKVSIYAKWLDFEWIH